MTNLLAAQHTRKSWSLPIPLVLLSDSITVNNMPIIKLFVVQEHLYKILQIKEFSLLQINFIYFKHYQVPFIKKKDAYLHDFHLKH